MPALPPPETKLRRAATILTLALAVSAPTIAQEGLPPDRVIHLWVDPLYGDDGLAAVYNPNPSSTCPGNPQETKPHHVVDQNTATNPPILLHASWPFKTITAAVNYIPLLPAVSAATGYTWRYAIIHLLPGVYARGLTTPVCVNTLSCGTWDYHPDNNLRANGETFPIRLPPYVSVQGTSALNTVIDLDADRQNLVGAGPAFEFGNFVSTIETVAPSGVGTFIDSVSVVGALELDGSQNADNPRYASAIYIGPRNVNGAWVPNVAASPTISNCFLVGNKVGILVAAGREPAPGPEHHGVKVFNNTIAFNLMGLWNGQYPNTSTLASGVSELIVVNNIFDAGDPESCGGTTPTGLCTSGQCYLGTLNRLGGRQAISGAQDFQGLANEDMTIVSGPSLSNHNAYEWGIDPNNPTQIPGRYNNGNNGSTQPLGAILPVCQIRPGSTNPPPPPTLRNIAPITGWPNTDTNQFRGILYVRDLICNWRYETPSPNLPTTVCPQTTAPCFDWSPLDFRLAPVASNATPSSVVQVPSRLNDVVDEGWSGTFPMTMGNLRVVNHPPSFLPLSGINAQNTWPYHAWDHDAEGFGNPRVWKHPAWPAKPFAIDLGADEFGDRVIAGYRFGTTAFLNVENYLPAGPLRSAMTPVDNKYVWFLGVPNSLTTLTPQPFRPKFRRVQHLGPPPSNYGSPGLETGWFGPWYFDAQGVGYYTAPYPVMSPHLAPDIHPWWPGLVPGLGPTNPIWQWCQQGFYNLLLYVDPTVGVIHPRGTYTPDLVGAYRWLDETLNFPGLPAPNFPTFGPFGRTDPALDQYDPWCRGLFASGSTGVFDTLPPSFSGTTITAIRFSLENDTLAIWGGGIANNNLQTFVVAVEQP